MKRFEHKILDVPTKGWFGGKVDFEELANKLGELGKQGWEVVTMGAPNMYNSSSRNVIIILKKEIL